MPERGRAPRARQWQPLTAASGAPPPPPGPPFAPARAGEWSLDKRHYGGAYPPRNLQLPPTTGHSAKNFAPKWLTMAWNEASANIPTWPDTKAMGTVGWRREAPSEAQIACALQQAAGCAAQPIAPPAFPSCACLLRAGCATAADGPSSAVSL